MRNGGAQCLIALLMVPIDIYNWHIFWANYCLYSLFSYAFVIVYFYVFSVACHISEPTDYWLFIAC